MLSHDALLSIVITVVPPILGYLIAKHRKTMPGNAVLIWIVILTALSEYHGARTGEIVVFDSNIYYNHAIQYFGYGLILGFLLKKSSQNRPLSRETNNSPR